MESTGKYRLADFFPEGDEISELKWRQSANVPGSDTVLLNSVPEMTDTRSALPVHPNASPSQQAKFRSAIASQARDFTQWLTRRP